MDVVVAEGVGAAVQQEPASEEGMGTARAVRAGVQELETVAEGLWPIACRRIRSLWHRSWD